MIYYQLDDYEREKSEKYKIIRELKSEMSDLSTTVEELENPLDRQGQYLRRNCILIRTLEHQKKDFRKKKEIKKYRDFNYRKLDETQDGSFKRGKERV